MTVVDDTVTAAGSWEEKRHPRDTKGRFRRLDVIMRDLRTAGSMGSNDTQRAILRADMAIHNGDRTKARAELETAAASTANGQIKSLAAEAQDRLKTLKVSKPREVPSSDRAGIPDKTSDVSHPDHGHIGVVSKVVRSGDVMSGPIRVGSTRETRYRADPDAQPGHDRNLSTHTKEFRTRAQAAHHLAEVADQRALDANQDGVVSDEERVAARAQGGTIDEPVHELLDDTGKAYGKDSRWVAPVPGPVTDKHGNTGTVIGPPGRDENNVMHVKVSWDSPSRKAVRERAVGEGDAPAAPVEPGSPGSGDVHESLARLDNAIRLNRSADMARKSREVQVQVGLGKPEKARAILQDIERSSIDPEVKSAAREAQDRLDSKPNVPESSRGVRDYDAMRGIASTTPETRRKMAESKQRSDDETLARAQRDFPVDTPVAYGVGQAADPPPNTGVVTGHTPGGLLKIRSDKTGKELPPSGFQHPDRVTRLTPFTPDEIAARSAPQTPANAPGPAGIHPDLLPGNVAPHGAPPTDPHGFGRDAAARREVQAPNRAMPDSGMGGPVGEILNRQVQGQPMAASDDPTEIDDLAADGTSEALDLGFDADTPEGESANAVYEAITGHDGDAQSKVEAGIEEANRLESDNPQGREGALAVLRSVMHADGQSAEDAVPEGGRPYDPERDGPQGDIPRKPGTNYDGIDPAVLDEVDTILDDMLQAEYEDGDMGPQYVDDLETLRAKIADRQPLTPHEAAIVHDSLDNAISEWEDNPDNDVDGSTLAHAKETLQRVEAGDLGAVPEADPSRYDEDANSVDVGYLEPGQKIDLDGETVEVTDVQADIGAVHVNYRKADGTEDEIDFEPFQRISVINDGQEPDLGDGPVEEVQPWQVPTEPDVPGNEPGPPDFGGPSEVYSREHGWVPADSPEGSTAITEWRSRIDEHRRDMQDKTAGKNTRLHTVQAEADQHLAAAADALDRGDRNSAIERLAEAEQTVRAGQQHAGSDSRGQSLADTATAIRDTRNWLGANAPQTPREPDAVAEAERTGHIGDADPAALARNRTDDELDRIATSMPSSTLEGRVARDEISRRASEAAGDDPSKASARAQAISRNYDAAIPDGNAPEGTPTLTRGTNRQHGLKVGDRVAYYRGTKDPGASPTAREKVRTGTVKDISGGVKILPDDHSGNAADGTEWMGGTASKFWAAKINAPEHAAPTVADQGTSGGAPDDSLPSGITGDREHLRSVADRLRGGDDLYSHLRSDNAPNPATEREDLRAQVKNGRSAKMQRAFRAAADGDHRWLNDHGFIHKDSPSFRASDLRNPEGPISGQDIIKVDDENGLIGVQRAGSPTTTWHKVNGNGQATPYSGPVASRVVHEPSADAPAELGGEAERQALRDKVAQANGGRSAKMQRAFTAAEQGDHAWLASHGFDAAPGDALHIDDAGNRIAIQKGDGSTVIHRINGNGRAGSHEAVPVDPNPNVFRRVGGERTNIDDVLRRPQPGERRKGPTADELGLSKRPAGATNLTPQQQDLVTMMGQPGTQADIPLRSDAHDAADRAVQAADIKIKDGMNNGTLQPDGTYRLSISSSVGYDRDAAYHTRWSLGLGDDGKPAAQHLESGADLDVGSSMYEVEARRAAEIARKAVEDHLRKQGFNIVGNNTTIRGIDQGRASAPKA